MIADYKNPHGKPTKQLNSIEFLLEQVVKGTYQYGEDKILQTTLPQAMIDHAIWMHKQEIAEAFDKGCDIGCDIGCNHNYHEGNNQGYQYYNQTFKK